MIYPKDYDENVKWRCDVFLKCERDAFLCSVLRDLASRDVVFFFNAFLWTYDPRTELKHLAFVTWDFQDKIIRDVNDAVERGENLFIDKSRDMGATWMVLGVFLWRWLFRGGENFRIGSRKEEYVDKKGDLDTHFEKFRYMIERLPGWLLPLGFDLKKHSQTYMRIINPENGNALIGEATNRDFARGGRQRAVLFDEFQAWESAEEAWRSASDATPCKIALGTPDGSGNKFAELSRTDEISRKIRVYWWLHPKKVGSSLEHLESVKSGLVYDKVGKYVVEYAGECKEHPGCYVDQYGKVRSEWYDRQHKERDEKNVASNVDINYVTSGRIIFDANKCSQNLDVSLPPEEVGDLVWLNRPVFDDMGHCINREKLSVEFVSNPNGLYAVYEKPKDGWEHGYLIGADTAEGLEQGDYDVASCVRRFGERPMLACCMRGHLPIHEYAEELAKFGTWYKRAVVAVERNNHGHGVILQLVRIYSRLYHKEIFTKGYADMTDRIGWETTSMSKPIIIGTLGKAIAKDEFECRDSRFWKETLTFVEDSGKMEAQGKSKGERCYDDYVMSMAISLYVHLNMPLPAQLRQRIELPRWKRSMTQKQGIVGFAYAR